MDSSRNQNENDVVELAEDPNNENENIRIVDQSVVDEMMEGRNENADGTNDQPSPEEFHEYTEVIESLNVKKTSEEMNLSPPLLVSVTSDGGNVLKGRRIGVSARLRSTCNKLLLHSHCVSHRCELELKSTAERQCELCNDVNDFLESLFTFHRASNIVTNTFRQSVKELSISGASAVIRVNGTRWISHTLNAMRNVLNSYVHIHCYEKLLILDKYAESQKAKARYYLKKLRDKKFLSFMVFKADVLDTVSVFSKVSQTRQLNVSQMEDTLQFVLSNLERFLKNPCCGKTWNSREKFGIEPADDTSKEYQIKFTSALR